MQTQRSHEGVTPANHAKTHSDLPCIEKDDLPCSQDEKKKEHRQPRNRGQLLSPAELDNHARPAPNKERQHMPKRVISSFNRHPLIQSASTAHVKTCHLLKQPTSSIPVSLKQPLSTMQTNARPCRGERNHVESTQPKQLKSSNQHFMQTGTKEPRRVNTANQRQTPTIITATAKPSTISALNRGQQRQGDPCMPSLRAIAQETETSY